jgi:predicted dehydrogenase
MNSPTEEGPTRRDVLKQSAGYASVLAMTGLASGGVFAGEDNTIRVALVGCGGRGTGAVVNALKAKNGPAKLVAMADVFPQRLSSSHATLAKRYRSLMDVPEDRQFIGFDGFQKAIDCLRKGDVVILATPPAFRWVHFGYAIEKGVHVFMEKPISVDGPSSVKMLRLAEESAKQNLKVGVGLMCRHCDARRELFDRIKDDEIGQILLLRAYRMGGRTASDVSVKKPDGISELMYQIQRFHSFLWASGGAFSDFLIHNIDEACWMKGEWPVKVSGSGGRTFRFDPKTGEEWIDQNFDAYSAEYTFADGTKLMLEDRRIPGCHQEFATYAHGTKGAAVVSSSGHWPSHAAIFKNQTFKGERAWDSGEPGPEKDPYQVEFDDLFAAIRGDLPYNETKRGAEASLVTAMGRKACHTGRIVTLAEMLKDDHDLTAGVDQLTLDSEAPIKADKDGRYPIPSPGYKRREF